MNHPCSLCGRSHLDLVACPPVPMSASPGELAPLYAAAHGALTLRLTYAELGRLVAGGRVVLANGTVVEVES